MTPSSECVYITVSIDVCMCIAFRRTVSKTSSYSTLYWILHC